MYIRRNWRVVLCIGMIALLMLLAAAQANEAVRISDASSINDWKVFFGEDVNTTENVGGVWTDKSVFTDAAALSRELGLEANLALTDPDHFLSVFSVISSNKSVKGHATIPTDTVFVLDMSGSMTEKSRLDNMVPALNNAIEKLMELNVANRVGIVLYYGANAGSGNVSSLGPAPPHPPMCFSSWDDISL